jgi:hypothetical protein
VEVEEVDIGPVLGGNMSPGIRKNGILEDPICFEVGLHADSMNDKEFGIALKRGPIFNDGVQVNMW